ncbi:Pimeloyl-ACP methyl ester carboxylesterase [Jatrophihabitans endophyticus]|uniref:Pimeloyl-ACP methyl ester carboxylesterase n=1 Tax=Jatrophihabitans endophyticus TaxID=1206085 RepID=A0A1M5GC02_9ACTN|nr:alpha/beta fold hydrolase [Jatrophihabitans endophyticus]SHG01208.1 Pimeloyl-ACP methyl ester carboxylesterase [Jatrophihabitans endophyticus]
MLAHERHGSGEPLVLIHGVTHRRQAWYPVLDQLAEHREVVLVDLPGHGESPDLVTAGRPVPDVLRDEFKAFLDGLGLVRPHVAGNSLGGLVALYAGANGHARSVTALSPAGFWRTPAEFVYTRQIFTRACVLAARLGPRAELLARSRGGRTVMYGLLTARPGRVSPDQAVGDLRGFLRSRPALATLLAAAEPFTATIPADVPVTIGWAARDLVLPAWQAETARRRLPAAEHVTLRGVGHVPMSDDPRRVADLLLRGSAPAATVAPLARPARRRTDAATA